jgi:threonine/homoserine/homoserine lactone efflux protein
LAVVSALLVTLLVLFGIPLVSTSHPRDIDEILAFFGVNLFLATLLGVGALVRIWRSNGRLRGLSFALYAAIAFPLALVNAAGITLVVATHGVLPWMITIAGLVYLNYLGVRRLWRWLSERHSAIANALRGDLTGWLAPKNGIQPT